MDSETQLCEAILYWVSASMQPCELVPNTSDSQLSLLSKVRVCLLPLGYVAGTRRNWVELGKNMILNMLKDRLQGLLGAIADDDMESYRIRITEYSKVFLYYIESSSIHGCSESSTFGMFTIIYRILVHISAPH